MSRWTVPLVAIWCAASPRAAAQDVVSVTLSHKTVQIVVGQRVGVYATANDARGVVLVGQRFEWTSSDPGIVRVEIDRDQPDLAYLIGAAEGLAQVQVRAGSRTDAVAVQVSRAAAPPPSVPRPTGSCASSRRTSFSCRSRPVPSPRCSSGKTARRPPPRPSPGGRTIPPSPR
jgi:hypothetical protein